MEHSGLCWIISCDILILLLTSGCGVMAYIEVEPKTISEINEKIILVLIGVVFILISIIPNMIKKYTTTNAPNNLFRCIAAYLIFFGFSFENVDKTTQYKIIRLVGIMTLIVALLIRILISFFTRKRINDPESLAQSFNVDGMIPPNQDSDHENKNKRNINLQQPSQNIPDHYHNQPNYNANNNIDNPQSSNINQPNNTITSEPVNFTNFYKKSSNPKTCIITVAFKLISIASFLILDIFLGNEAAVILIVILFGAMDFWFTKNISGRILVGLRWWNKIKKETGQEVWIFESKNEQSKSKADQWTFWTSLYIATGFWVFIVVWDIIRFRFIWATVAFVAASFCCINLYGFFKCSSIQKENLKNLGVDLSKKALFGLYKQ